MDARIAAQRAGEHFVLFRVHQEGMLAALAPPGSAAADVLIVAPDDGIVATLQVKTRIRGNEVGWRMSAEHELIRAPRSFYAFVDMEVPTGALPITYVVPSREVASMLAASHKAWLSIPEHNDSRRRRVKPSHPFKVPGYPDGWMEQYRESWGRLRAAVEHRPEPLNNGEYPATAYAPALLPTPPAT